MKKYINKLFKWLGYVPKGEYEFYEGRFNGICAINRDILNCHCEYIVIHSTNVFHILAKGKKAEFCAYIKAFPYHDDDSKDYARICAEELCEMLNEKY